MAVAKKSEKAKRSEVVNIRVEPNQRDLIDTAANLYGKSRSAFILDAACRQAEEALLDRRVFALNEEQWESFNEALNSPPTENPKLAALLAQPAPWE